MVRKLWPNWPVVPTVLMYLLDMTKVNTLHKKLLRNWKQKIGKTWVTFVIKFCFLIKINLALYSFYNLLQL